MQITGSESGFTVEKMSKDNLFDRIEFLDRKAAMYYSMEDVTVFREFLSVYVETAKDEELKKAYADEDWKNYKRIVHGVKGTSLMIGANEVADSAKQLEDATERDMEFVRNHHEAFISLYQAFIDKIKQVL